MCPKDLAFKQLLYEKGFKTSKDVLDFGCADGIWLERVLADNKKAKGIGVDISKTLIELANLRKNKRGNYLCNLNKWPKVNKSFDFCISLDVFEHIVKKEIEVREIYSHMSKGGKFVFFTLNPSNQFTFDWFLEKMGSDYLYKRADHKKENFINPERFKKILEKNGFRNVNYSLYAGPANLFWDVSAYIYFPFVDKLFSVLNFKEGIKSFIYINDLFLRFIYPFNVLIDKIFFMKGYSNGYFIWGEK